MRGLGYGLLGPDALSITYRLDGQLYTKPTGPDGAYLVVGPPMSGGGGERFTASIVSGVIVSVTYRSGRVCQATVYVRPPTSGCSLVGYVPPRVLHVTAEQVRAPVSVKLLRLEPYCIARRAGHPTLQLPCGSTPPGYRIEPNNPANDQQLVQISWTARIPASSLNSLYDYQVNYPCNHGGIEGTTHTNIRAGQRIAERTQVPLVSNCQRPYTVTVAYVPNTGPGGVRGGGPPGHGSVPVGHASFTIK